ADGHASGWVITDETKTGADGLTVRLGADDQSAAGRFVNLEGKPVAGVKVQLIGLCAPRPGTTDLAGMMAEIKAKGIGLKVEREHVNGFEGSWIGRDVGRLFPPVTTGADGRFVLSGVGPERVAVLRVSGPGVESRNIRLVTRATETLTVAEWEKGQAKPGLPGPGGTAMTYVGTGADVALAPGRTVTGVVKDKGTGKPLAGCLVETEKLANEIVSGRYELRAVTDADGKYTLTGLPLGRGNELRASPAAGRPYLMQLRSVPVPEGFNPAAVDFELVRGVALDVKAMDAVSGKAIAGRFDYFLFLDDPIYRTIPGLTMPHGEESQAKDGSIRLIVPATNGLIAFRSVADEYPIAVGAEQFKDRSRGVLIQTAPHLCHATNYNLLQAVEVKPGDQAKSVTLKLERGRSVKGRVLDPYGKPLAGCLVRGLKSSKTVFGLWEREPMKSAEFEARDIGSGKPRAVAFIHKERKLAGTVRVNGGEKEAVEVRLAPWATLRGRLVDADGKPMVDVRLGFVQSLEDPDPVGAGDLPGRDAKTDADGRFTLSGFAPGVRYSLAAIGNSRIYATFGRDLQFEAGEAKDLGDVVGKMGE
ncbi:MAG TPA: carboxypeptidase-like regulatory domain-containing protein, partial [Gemmataceae bacterium]|nr:carboxypeptidase-like regulatory domain-containing protein [Gemmataceae bacterium]